MQCWSRRQYRASCYSLAIPTKSAYLDGSLSGSRPHWRIYTLALKADAGRKEAIWFAQFARLFLFALLRWVFKTQRTGSDQSLAANIISTSLKQQKLWVFKVFSKTKEPFEILTVFDVGHGRAIIGSLCCCFSGTAGPFETGTYRGKQGPNPSHGSNRQVRNATGCHVACEGIAWSRWNPLKPCSTTHRRSSRKQSSLSCGCLGFKKKVGFRDWLSGKDLSDPRPQLSGLPEMSSPPWWSYFWGLGRRISAKPRLEDKLRSPKEARFGRIDIDHPPERILNWVFWVPLELARNRGRTEARKFI